MTIDESKKNNEDALIQKFSESLNRLTVPEGLRASNKKYIADAFRFVPAKAGPVSNWFKRRISVPFPVAAGFLLIFCLLLILYSFSLTSHFKESETMVAGQQQASPIDRSENSAEPHYSEQGTYIAGIGFVERSQRYVYVMENEYENN